MAGKISILNQRRTLFSNIYIYKHGRNLKKKVKRDTKIVLKSKKVYTAGIFFNRSVQNNIITRARSIFNRGS